MVVPSRRHLVLLGLDSRVLSGCTVHEADAMHASRIGYNEAVQARGQRKLLLNRVRLRFAESPELPAISSISTQMNEVPRRQRSRATSA